ncbi:hypothetical protein DXG01_001047 [Tephrocybe rancida]|nr:hypothetical protein DXG01_001047 [Tephrocybe rancida]
MCTIGNTPNPRASTGLTSTSLDRAPAPSKTFVRGKSGYVPFWPGGLEDPLVKSDDSSSEDKGARGLRTIPPGLSRGLRLPGEEIEDEDLIALNDLEASRPKNYTFAEDGNSALERDEIVASGASEIDELLPTTTTHLKPSKPQRRLKRANIQKRDWAHVIDVNTPLSNFHELVPEMAHKYPFELDTFQKQAVYHLEMGDSVFVAAHTSAGKTVVAEYAIALAEKHMTRAIYTSPIKALSNQKFRDFKQTFSPSSVGILTGDVQINPEAPCLVMTTEILRSMLYKGADLIRDVEFVIFDEVHYVNDAERGVVWEEVIIMLPDHVNIILLSATVPNTKEFADWVGRTKKKDIYVISTAQRPVPLEHFLYAGRELYKIVDSKRNFLGQGYKEAGEALRRKQDKEREAAGLPPVQRVGARGAAPVQRGQRGGTPARGGRGAAPPARGRGGGGGGGGGAPRNNFASVDKNLYVHLLGHLRKKALLPVVVFTFSKKRCEENAATLTNLDLCTSVEKSEVHVAIEKALSRLKGSDKKLPQIGRMRDLLTRGIGVHHGGLLPLVKEVCHLTKSACCHSPFNQVVEILFARGLVKVLFATETFAMGVNMPAKCVVFSGIRKHDGRSFREILPGEYTQMAGRAGRRGLDPTGTVIIIANDSLPEQTALHTMMLGTPGKLSSQFRLTYNMILNLLRVEALKVEEMIKRSFSENASQRLLPDQQKKVTEASNLTQHMSEKVLSTLQKLDCDICLPDINDFYDDSFDIVSLNQRLLRMAVTHPQGAKSMIGGRVIILGDGHFRTYTAAILLKPAPLQTTESGLLEKVKTFYVLALVSAETKSGDHDVDNQTIPPYWPPTPESLVVSDGIYELRAVPLTSVALVTNRSIKVEVDSIVERHLISRMKDGIAALQVLVDEWQTAGEIPENEWDRMRAMDFQELLQSRNSITKRLSMRSCTLCGDFTDHYAVIHGEKMLRVNIANLKLAISDQNLELIPDYEQRVAVLQELKFIDENSTVLLKGRVACEINSANELVLTELILENTLAGYEPEEVVALLSCFVFQEKTEVEPLIPPKLEAGRDAIVALSDKIGRIQDYHKVAVEDFRSNLKFGLVEVVYEWAKGMPFEQITALTDVAEGTIVRVITRLDETCREVRDAARVIGDAELFKKMEEAQIKIKRDIMAKPLNNSDISFSPIIFSEPISFSGHPRCSAASEKRAHELSDDDEAQSQKTRRVNPQRLAARLGPEIVADMESLIYPGAKMPSFEVRRIIQERYAVDRRHIYDYFHSRGTHSSRCNLFDCLLTGMLGLRVAKEDRHTNLTRGRLSKALARQQLEKREIEKVTPCVPPDADRCVDKKTTFGETSLIEQAKHTFKSHTMDTHKAPTTKSSTAMRKQVFDSSEHLACRNAKLVASERIAGSTLRQRNPPHESTCTSAVSKPPTKKRRTVPVAPLMESPSRRTPSPCPAFTPLENVLDNFDDEPFYSGLDATPDIYLDLFGDLVDSSAHTSYKKSPQNIPAVIEEHRPLSQSERQELYNFINDNIGSSCGIIEKAGTYGAYMKEHTDHYFDRISFKANSARIYHGHCGGPHFNSVPFGDEGEIDFRNWLSDYDELDLNKPEEDRAASYHPAKEHLILQEGKVIPGPFPQHAVTVNSLVPSDTGFISCSQLDLLGPASPVRLPSLHYDYNVDLPAIPTLSTSPNTPGDRANIQVIHFSSSHSKRPKIQLRPTPSRKMNKSSGCHPSTHLSSKSPNDLCGRSPARQFQTADQMFLHVSKPSRIRTTSAGGGL